MSTPDHHRPITILGHLLLALLTSTSAIAMQDPAVFTSGDDDYDTFRIPALIEAADGTLLAFAEGRVGGRGDSGNIDLVLKRSRDGGTTWSDLERISPVVWRRATRLAREFGYAY